MPASRSIAVYHDEGTGEFSRGALASALAEAFAGKVPVRRIGAAEIRTSDDWHAGALLLAIPGGADRPYCERLSGTGNASIRRFVESGGALLGVCAGAYYACARIEFQGAAKAAITEARELALFAGTARGGLRDLAAPYALDHLRCAEVVTVFAPAAQTRFPALYWGGPEFLPDPGARFTPLLEYVTPDGRRPLAAVRADVGKGRVVLTGVHPEISGSQFPIEVSRFGDDSFDHGMRVAADLTRVERERRQLFDLLIAALELDS